MPLSPGSPLKETPEPSRTRLLVQLDALMLSKYAATLWNCVTASLKDQSER